MAIEIFLSYRRVETELATALQARLEQGWGFRGQVFRDTSTPGGERWEKFIFGRLAQSRVMLALVGPNWSFQRAGADPDQVDFVQREFEHAAKAGTPILIVEAGRDGQHAVDALPPSLRASQRWQTCRVSADLNEYDLRQVAEALKRAGVTPEKDSDPFTVAGSLAPPEHETRLTALVREAQVDDVRVAPLLIVTGSVGLGRNALVRSVAHALETDRLVLGADYDMPVRHRSFAVLANWFADLVTAASSGELADCGLSAAWLARRLVTSGRDLLSRSIVAADQLADLGDDDLELAVVHAAGRVDARHAAFNPQRIRDQALAILRAVQKKTGRSLLAVVGDLETVDRESLTTIAHLRTGWGRGAGLDLPRDVPRRAPHTLGARPAGRPLPRASGTAGRRGPAGGPRPARGPHRAIGPRRGDDQAPRAVPGGCGAEGDGRSRRHHGPSAVGRRRSHREALASHRGRDASSLVPTRADIMDHLIEASSPLHLRPVLDIGALMGAPFPFDVAYAVAVEEDAAGATSDDGWSELVEPRRPGVDRAHADDRRRAAVGQPAPRPRQPPDTAAHPERSQGPARPHRHAGRGRRCGGRGRATGAAVRTDRPGRRAVDGRPRGGQGCRRPPHSGRAGGGAAGVRPRHRPLPSRPLGVRPGAPSRRAGHGRALRVRPLRLPAWSAPPAGWRAVRGALRPCEGGVARAPGPPARSLERHRSARVGELAGQRDRRTARLAPAMRQPRRLRRVLDGRAGETGGRAAASRRRRPLLRGVAAGGSGAQRGRQPVDRRRRVGAAGRPVPRGGGRRRRRGFGAAGGARPSRHAAAQRDAARRAGTAGPRSHDDRRGTARRAPGMGVRGARATAPVDRRAASGCRRLLPPDERQLGRSRRRHRSHDRPQPRPVPPLARAQ